MTLAKRTLAFPIAALMTGMVALSACSGAEVAATLSAAKDKAAAGTPTPSATSPSGSSSLSGNVPVEGSGASPKAGATAAPTPATSSSGASPTPTPVPTPASTYQAFSVEVTVSPSTASINLRDPEGIGGSNYPSSVVLTADVLLSNNSHVVVVTWKTSDEQVAAVSPAGVVTAGTKPGVATITATAADGQSSGTCKVTVEDDGSLDVTVN